MVNTYYVPSGLVGEEPFTDGIPNQVQVLKLSEVKEEIDDINNPDYECKCGFKGKADKFDYDKDAYEISCPKCGCGIDYKEINFEKELKKRLGL